MTAAPKAADLADWKVGQKAEKLAAVWAAALAAKTVVLMVAQLAAPTAAKWA